MDTKLLEHVDKAIVWVNDYGVTRTTITRIIFSTFASLLFFEYLNEPTLWVNLVWTCMVGIIQWGDEDRLHRYGVEQSNGIIVILRTSFIRTVCRLFILGMIVGDLGMTAIGAIPVNLDLIVYCLFTTYIYVIDSLHPTDPPGARWRKLVPTT